MLAQNRLVQNLIQIIAETNGISISQTLELLQSHMHTEPTMRAQIAAFRLLLGRYHQGLCEMSDLLEHPISDALRGFFSSFPARYREEHIHLTGSLTAEFLQPFIEEALAGPGAQDFKRMVTATYGHCEIKGLQDIRRMIALQPGERFDRYLKILLLPKLILTTREIHDQAAYHLAETLYKRYNIGYVCLKFTYSRATNDVSEKLPHQGELASEDVLLGLFEGFRRFQTEHTDFSFDLAPSFRKEHDYFDSSRFASKHEDFNARVAEILGILERYPELERHVRSVDTVGDEKELYRKTHFLPMSQGLRKLKYQGFEIASHHGETFHTLRRGIQAVDNAMNMWQIDTLEHGLSLGINPNYYFQKVFERIMEHNSLSRPIEGPLRDELQDFRWNHNQAVCDKLLSGEGLSASDERAFVKVKFHHARDVEQYQHDVLNRAMQKNIGFTALPSSNQKLTHYIPGFKDHPFSWWEKKGVKLGMGTDNYVALSTDFISEMLIMLYSEPTDLKITKLLMMATGESRRPVLSRLLWEMRQSVEK